MVKLVDTQVSEACIERCVSSSLINPIFYYLNKKSIGLFYKTNAKISNY